MPVLELVVLVFAETEYFTIPSPLPLLPEDMVIHKSLLFAVQLHPFVAVTLTFPVPPDSLMRFLVREMEYVHDTSLS